jgi:hypothetical protein
MGLNQARRVKACVSVREDTVVRNRAIYPSLGVRSPLS